MKRFSLAFMMSLFLIPALQAQDSYTNDRITNTSDIYGTARYVGMGGAMGVMGAEISAMSNNPAGIALIRKNDLSISMGALFQDARPIDGDAKAHYSFDQVGFVAHFGSMGDDYMNFGLNFQKKLNFNHSMIAENKDLGGLSQAAQFSGLLSQKYSIDAALPYCTAYMGLYDVYRADGSYYQFRANDNSFYRTTSGNLYGIDFNFSGNIQDRVFIGMTIGVDILNYRSSTSYVEFRDGLINNTYLANNVGGIQDYILETNSRIKGSGFNLKLGGIFRPIEDSPFRIGVTLETPTWYTLKQQDAYYTVYSKFQNQKTTIPGSQQWQYQYLPESGDYEAYDSPDDNYLEFNLHSPWKFRVGMASTVSEFMAWDIEYEYSLNQYARMGYPVYESKGFSDQSVNTDQDPAMNALTESVANGVHNLRAGIEVKPVKPLAIRAGYNFYSSPFKKNARYSQEINSYYMNKVLGTDYMNLGATHIVSFGLGYSGKAFYADIAYKYRMQKGDFYAFDDKYQTTMAPENQYITEASALQPVEVNLNRHNIVFTLGYKF